MIRISIFVTFLVFLSAGGFAQVDAEMQARIDALKVPIEIAPPPAPEILQAIEEPSANEAVSALRLEFEEGQSTLSEDQEQALLGAVLVRLEQNKRVEVLSYAYQTGLNDNDKRRLALERALSARKTLEDHGVSYRVVDLLPKTGEAGQNILIVTLRD